MPKTLLTISGMRIIDIILKGVLLSGINDVVVVTGYKGDTLEARLRENSPDLLNIEFVRNHRWQMPNGYSVLAAREALEGERQFILLMSDHIFEPEMLKMVVDTPLKNHEALLAVDFKIDEIPDIDDGMKVRCTRLPDGSCSISGLSKSYRSYQAIDCGMFKLDSGFFDVMTECTARGKDSLSDACNSYADAGRMKGMDIGGRRWIDIDTPEMFSFHSIIDRITSQTTGGISR
jgi:choline kinase